MVPAPLRSSLHTLAAVSASLSTTGCTGAGKNVANRKSGLLSPLQIEGHDAVSPSPCVVSSLLAAAQQGCSSS